MELDFEAIDADNHYYESIDAFTRHLDPAFKTARRSGRPVRQAGAAADRRQGLQLHPEPDLRPDHRRRLPRPASSAARSPKGVDPRSLMQVEPLHPEYQDRDARVAVDGRSRASTRSLHLPHPRRAGSSRLCSDDVAATMASLSAFNRWLEDDWGFDYQDRLIAAPMLSLADPQAALAELDSLIERGARIVHIRPAPVPGEHGTSRSLGDPLHDPVWARLAAASIPVAFHLGDSGYEGTPTSAWGGSGGFEGYGNVEHPHQAPGLGSGDPRHGGLARH